MENKSLQQWLSFLDSIEAPKEINEEFNRVFHTKGITYPMKLYSIYILKKEVAKGNLSALKLEAMINGTLKGTPESVVSLNEKPFIVITKGDKAEEEKNIWDNDIEDLEIGSSSESAI